MLTKKQIKEILVIATVFRGGSFLDGILSTKIKGEELPRYFKLTPPHKD